MNPKIVNAQGEPNEPVSEEEARSVDVRKLTFNGLTVIALVTTVVGYVSQYNKTTNIADNTATAVLALQNRLVALENARLAALQSEIQNAGERVTKSDISEIRQDIKDLRNELRAVRR